MSLGGGGFGSSIKAAQDQLTGEKPVTPSGYDGGRGIDVLIEALSGIPQTLIMEELANSISSGASGVLQSATKEGENGTGGVGVGGGGGRGYIISPTDVKRTFTTASAPLIDSESVLSQAVNPNLQFNIGAVAASAVASIIGEMLSIGQIDKILEPLLSLLNLTDAPTVFARVREIRLQNQVFLPYQYYVNNLNPLQVPPYADLIRLRVREDRLGNPLLTQEEFIQQMRYLGYAEFWSNALWDSHFTLPSNAELFDMYNTGLITYDQLRKQLIINDIAPEWVDNIAQIAKRFPTMPELRMMARRLPMPREIVERALKAQGIRDEYFDYYVDMFNNWEVDSIRKRRQTAIIGSYRDGYLSDEEFKNTVANTGASDGESDELLKEAQWKRFDRRMSERQKTVLKLLQKGRIVREEAEEVLLAMGFEPIDVDHWLDYTVAASGAVVEIEKLGAEEIEGLETEEEILLKVAEWEELHPPLFFPQSTEPEGEA